MIGADGKLAGVASLQLHQQSSGERPVPINLVVPIELLPPILDDLKAGRPSAEARPWLGVFADDSWDKVIVLGVTPGGPAQRAELRKHDVILAVGGREVSTLVEFYRELWSLGAPGVKAPLTVEREGDVFDVSITTRDRRSYLKTPVLH
jgi:S1-C subfamily serine protease